MSQKTMTMRNPLLRLGILAASSFNFAGASLLVAIWNINPFYYLLAIFAISTAIGAVMADIKDAIVYTYASMGIGIAITTLIFMAPYILLQEPVSRINIGIMVLYSAIGKAILLSLIVYFVGAFLGSFLGEKSLE